MFREAINAAWRRGFVCGLLAAAASLVVLMGTSSLTPPTQNRLTQRSADSSEVSSSAAAGSFLTFLTDSSGGLVRNSRLPLMYFLSNGLSVAKIAADATVCFAPGTLSIPLPFARSIRALWKYGAAAMIFSSSSRLSEESDEGSLRCSTSSFLFTGFGRRC